jgi:hypothetical protein
VGSVVSEVERVATVVCCDCYAQRVCRGGNAEESFEAQPYMSIPNWKRGLLGRGFSGGTLGADVGYGVGDAAGETAGAVLAHDGG